MQLNTLLINVLALATSASCLVAGQAKRSNEIVARAGPPPNGNPVSYTCLNNCQAKQDQCKRLCPAFCDGVAACLNTCNDGCNTQYAACVRDCA
ncbi:hypothetical protein E4U43_002030 [Claviceps pusilla]|uniref:Uncharacterized protein n=1 Tax=Claviceps pusilla TaxID=123648 RepID=A0A9P7SVI7_9HYPO|nr:hypothetical protein E4U43_002030 [Claviceps pusilla]